jgi:hypothetical protein
MRRYLLILAVLLSPLSTYAQVFELGPSPSSLFSTVINIPPTTTITSAGSSTQINLTTGGSITGDFNANAGSEINISGGSVGPHPTRLNANSGSEVNVSGGRVTNLLASSGSVVNFLGGGDSNSIFRASAGSVFNLFGQFDFRGLTIEAGGRLNVYGRAFSLNNVPLNGLVPGVPFEIADRGNIFFDSLLRNGGSFRFQLTSVDPAATLAVTLVPEPNSTLIVLASIAVFHFIPSHSRTRITT